MNVYVIQAWPRKNATEMAWPVPIANPINPDRTAMTWSNRSRAC